MFGHDIDAFRLDVQICLSENTQSGCARSALGFRQISLSETGIIKECRARISYPKPPGSRLSSAWTMIHCLILESVYGYIL